MAAEDELALPQVPEAKPQDPEDVSWALSTAEAMWARGDHLEGIKWVRKAAEAAADVEDDARALELAKAASELATLIARRSRASFGHAPGLAGGPPPEVLPTSVHPVSSTPTTARSQAPPLPAPRPSAAPYGSGSTTTPPPLPLPRSAPPLPPKASQAPRTPEAATAPLRVRAPTLPFGMADPRQGPQTGRGILSDGLASDKVIKARRRSRENLEIEARRAVVLATAPQVAVGSETATHALSAIDGDDTAVGTHAGIGRRSDPDPTVVTRLEDLHAERKKSADDWDAFPTESLTSDEIAQTMSEESDRKTTTFALPAAALSHAHEALGTPAPLPPVRAPQISVHDPGIETTQAVRVVVWRDANGVHVAPAGTAVSAIKIDAVLVVLEEGADLTAWLSQRER